MRIMLTAAMMLSLVGAAHAEDLVITSLSGNGELSWSYPTNGVNEYRVEWCADLSEGLWTDLESGIHGIMPSASNMTVRVPMHYRILAMGTPPPSMAYIPAGHYDMGDTFDEGQSDESPVHSVYVSGFYIDRYEVSLQLWQDVHSWATNNGYSFSHSGSGTDTNYPVHTVNWYDSVKWANARSEKEGLKPCYYTDSSTNVIYKTGEIELANDWVVWGANGYRLPTEAEWEKAARGGASRHRFPWTDDTISHGRANYFADSSYSYDLSSGTHPDGFGPFLVGAFTPNGYGLYDLAGNVAEWCWDRYSATYYAVSAPDDPRGPTTGDRRVCRGGGYDYPVPSCIVSTRDQSLLNNAWGHSSQGFRLVRTP